MESTRQKKVSRLIQKELALIFQKTGHLLLPNAIVTVTIVRVSQDLGYANVFVSIFPDKTPTHSLKVIIDNQWHIRKRLAGMVKNQLRIVPELKFYLDDSAEYAEKIDQLLKK